MRSAAAPERRSVKARGLAQIDVTFIIGCAANRSVGAKFFDECGEHVGADFKCDRGDAGTDGYREERSVGWAGSRAELFDGVRNDVGDDAAPAGVDSGDCVAIRGRQQDWNAIGDADCERALRIVSYQGIRLDATREFRTGHDDRDLAAVNLMHPAARVFGTTDRTLEDPVVVVDARPIVLHVAAVGISQVE
jgi:hypothetical protein